MPRIEPVQISQAQGKSRELLEGIQRNLGMVPNLLKTLAHSPAALNAYVSINQALGQALTPQLREQIALAVAGANQCDYCASAHTALGAKAGIDPAEMAANLQSLSTDSKTQAALHFVSAVIDNRGRVSDEQLASVREAGYSDGQVAEMVALTAANVLTNYFNHVAKTAIDFPVIETRRSSSGHERGAA